MDFEAEDFWPLALGRAVLATLFFFADDFDACFLELDLDFVAVFAVDFLVAGRVDLGDFELETMDLAGLDLDLETTLFFVWEDDLAFDRDEGRRDAAFEDEVFLLEGTFDAVFTFALELVEGFRETDDFERLGCLDAAFFETLDTFPDALLAVRLAPLEADLIAPVLPFVAFEFFDTDFVDERPFDFDKDLSPDFDFDFERGEVFDLVALLTLLVLTEVFNLLGLIAFEEDVLDADDFEQDPPARLIRPHVRVVISFCFG